MRNADISPATDEDRRREFVEAADRALGPTVNLAELKYRVRAAMEGDRARGNAIAHALAAAIAAKNSLPEPDGV